jgi:hypothetical protein
MARLLFLKRRLASGRYSRAGYDLAATHVELTPTKTLLYTRLNYPCHSYLVLAYTILAGLFKSDSQFIERHGNEREAHRSAWIRSTLKQVATI